MARCSNTVVNAGATPCVVVCGRVQPTLFMALMLTRARPRSRGYEQNLKYW